MLNSIITFNGKDKIMKEELVSVMIPFYNVKNYLDNCIESAVNQSYKNLEIILVDDGSTDGSAKIGDEWAKKDKRIKIIHKKNGGISDARNICIENATGKYLVFLDSDDKMDSDAVSILYKTLIKNNADIVMTDNCYFKDIEKKLIFDKINYTETIYKDNDVFDLVFSKKIPIIMVPWGKIYKKEIFDNIKFPYGKIHEDDYICHRILYRTKTFVYISTKLFFNHLRIGSITASKFTTKRFDAIDAKVDRVEFCKKYKEEYYQTAILQLLRTVMLYYTLARMSKIEKKELKKVLKIYDEYYNKAVKRPILYFMFKHFRNITYFLLKIYVKKNKLLYTNYIMGKKERDIK